MPVALLSSLAPIEGRLPSLQTLEIHIFPMPSDSEERIEVLNVFKPAPLLHRLSISDSRTVSVVVPWEQLTVYLTGAEDFWFTLECLGQMRNLVVCHIDRHDFADDGVVVPVHLPHLRSLSVTAETWSTDGHSGHLLQSLTAPPLESCGNRVS
ncbi:hypothetical protein B0H11DRAFT_2296069 [Mycena galericulata]|nr:hypothetical protein B0H11DRAFT_2296069 [Mycena galericulata]